MSEPLARFDGAALWATLSADAQAKIGAAALEITCGFLVQSDALHREQTGQLDLNNAWDRAAHFFDLGLLGDQLDELVLAATTEDPFSDTAGRPLLPLGYGKICRGCGCSQDDACKPSCSWVEDDLCSACGGVEP